eukprot:scaffold273757_cov19-Prasinocladus_malaysianus.AAC.1
MKNHSWGLVSGQARSHIPVVALDMHSSSTKIRPIRRQLLWTRAPSGLARFALYWASWAIQ